MKAKRNRVKIICHNCKKTFLVIPSIAKAGRKFCNMKCKHAYHRKTSVCLHCGKEFMRYRSDERKFCSKDCTYNSDAWRESRHNATVEQWRNPESHAKLEKGIKKRSESPAWRNAKHFQRGVNHPRYNGNAQFRETEQGRYRYKKWRKAVFARDKYTCQKCERKGVQLRAHHIKEWAKFPESRYDIDNGITVCSPCHNKIHGRVIKSPSKICENCGQKFTPKKSKQRFCSLPCFHKSDACRLNR